MHLTTATSTKTKPKRKFTPEEDELIITCVLKHGEKWALIQKLHFADRTGRQLRERYVNYLDPNISHRDFDPREDQDLLKYQEMFSDGNYTNWKLVAQFFKDRTDVNLKNRYNYLKRNMEKGKLTAKTPIDAPVSQGPIVEQQVAQPLPMSSMFDANPVSVTKESEREEKIRQACSELDFNYCDESDEVFMNEYCFSVLW